MTSSGIMFFAKHLGALSAKHRHQGACEGYEQGGPQQLEHDPDQRRFEVAGRKCQAQVDRRDEKPAGQTREGECFESHLCLGTGTDKWDQERKSDCNGRCGHAGQIRHDERQKEDHKILGHVDIGEELHHGIDGTAGLEIELEQQSAKDQEREVELDT